MGGQPSNSPGYWQRQWRALLPFGIWTVYAGFFALHIVVRSYGDNFLPWRSPEGFDHALTGTDPSLWLQHHLYGKSFALDRLTTGAHLAWYAFPFLIGAVITVRRRRILVPYLTWLTAAWFISDAIFYMVPTTPPWMVDGGVTRVLFTRGWVDYAGVDTNPVAAFPSLHAAIPVVIGLFLWTNWREARFLTWLSWGYGMLVGFSVIYLGEHWLVDVLGGYAVAFGVRWLFVSGSVRSRVRALRPELQGVFPAHREKPVETIAAVDEQAA